MTLDDKPLRCQSGYRDSHAAGSSHGLKQVGADDLVVIITFETK